MPQTTSSSQPQGTSLSFRAILRNSAGFWEPRRLLYNLALLIVAFAWIILTWPHFRPAFTLSTFLTMCVLALLANLCYTAAYLFDLPIQGMNSFTRLASWRWGLWFLGTALAILLENYWIADEIYPFVR